ncbi:hypothetical protein L0337_15525 [candidate division KSB1 bacterium]|nr:hypothetical protein [candidate division KSB1 bacterium]
MKSKRINILFCLVISAVLLLAFNACELVDPTNVTNPEITDEALRENSTGGTASLITGLRREFSDAVRSAHIIDVVSDNYFNTASFISNNLDRPSSVTPLDLTLPTVYNAQQELHALADFGLSTIIPNDKLATDEQRAEARFYKGMALVLLAENFSAFPIQELGPTVTSRQAATLAVDEFKTAFDLTPNANMKINCKLALARAYRLAGDKANAAAEAQAALALPNAANYVFYAQYDAAQLTNTPVGRIVTLADLQPLPRLDFLDPKYTVNNTPIPSLKAEEAHLIIAEVALVDGDLAGARLTMANAVTLALSRPVTNFNDSDNRRNRPNDPTWTVKAGPNAPAVPGLIQKRGGGTAGTQVKVYAISGTSLTVAAINALATANATEHYRILYLLRQEIFFLEARRMSDLGIRLPVTDRQIQTNQNVAAAAVGKNVNVPSYIPAGGTELDQFTVDAAAGVVTIAHDMNQLIAENIQQVSPFLAQ